MTVQEALTEVKIGLSSNHLFEAIDTIDVALTPLIAEECRPSSCGNVNASTFLDWCADRFVYVYNESPNVDFVHYLRKLSKLLKQLGNNKENCYEGTCVER